MLFELFSILAALLAAATAFALIHRRSGGECTP